MGGLFGALTTSAGALKVFDQALDTVTNNVANAGTPGYASQNFTIQAQPFDPAVGLPGGIAAGEIQSSRDEYLEQAVRQDQQSFGQADQTVTELSNVQPLFDVTGNSGIPAALDAFFQSFSALSVSPNDAVARSTVLSSADSLAQQFNGAAAGLSNASTSLNTEISGTVATINGLTQQISQLNTQLKDDPGSRTDPAVDANLHNALESLSGYVNITALWQPDGSVNVLMDGQTPLVMGDTQYALQAATASGAAAIEDSSGDDVTAQVAGGRLAALVDMQNTVLPGFSNSLNQLAAGVADQVNNALLNGVDQSGNAGAQMFRYDNASDAASTMQVTGITTDEIAAALPSAPGGNGNALTLAALDNSPQLDGMTFTDFYSNLASQVGQSLDSAKEDQTTQQDLLNQAQTTRSNTEGVSLDQEATQMIEFQRAYQATADVVSTVDNLTETLINMMTVTT
ncbi:MAG: flagellar hook-associated protein FlgK [Bryobacteraceae bacterium]|jgi:flagellar hook-associated protein 1 FlgK